MEKIIVNPRQVRALGDIVSPKGVADFEKYCCTLTESTDASFGDLYTSEFLPGARLVIDYPGSVSVDDDDFTVDVLLKDDSGAVISGASVYCDFNDDLSSETTDSNGEASFTLSCDGESTEYRFRIWYVGTDSLAGAICRGVVTVVDYESVDFSLMVDNPVLCGGEFAEFVAKVDELNGSGRVPVSGAVVEFYMDVDEVEPASISLISSKDTLSYADGGDSCTLTATVLGSDSQPYEGATVVFKAYKGGTLVETIGSDTTDASGVASVSYSSKGAGDLSIRAECMNLQETYSITDAWKHISSGSYTGTSSTISFQELYESSAYDNIEISATIKAPNKGFSLAFLKSKDSSSSIQDNIFTIGVDGANYLAVARVENNNTTLYTSDLHMQYTANSDLNCVIRIENGVVTLKLNSYTYTSTPITGLKYVGVRNWNNAKTVTYTDLIVKPL